MRTALRAFVSVIALISVLDLAGAQVAPAAPQAKQDSEPGQTQKAEQAQQSTPGRAGASEPSSEAPSAPPQDTATFVNGRLAVPGAPADSQTVPAKFSERNAALDQLPTMALPLPLTDEQKSRIREALGKTNTPVADVRLHPADQVPSTVALSEIPAALTGEIPVVADYQYVRTPDGIVLVRAPERTVVGEISK